MHITHSFFCVFNSIATHLLRVVCACSSPLSMSPIASEEMGMPWRVASARRIFLYTMVLGMCRISLCLVRLTSCGSSGEPACHKWPLELRFVFPMCHTSFSFEVAADGICGVDTQRAPHWHLFQKQTHVADRVSPIIVSA